MVNLGNPNRRIFIAANLCLTAGLGMGFATAALGQEIPGSLATSSPSLSANTWNTVATPEFRSFKRDYFYALTDDNRPVRLRLLKVIAGNSGPHRPRHLARREGLIAVFNAAKADCDWFIENGHQSVGIWHHALGNSRVFLGAVKNARGQYKIEMVLN